jgi:hypothetical protein
MKELPVSDMTFRKIISEGRLYADKTRYIHQMINDYTFCFLSRPRRFGKTLLLDAMKELFLGNRELFEGLWIDPSRSSSGLDSDSTLATEPKSDYDFKKHPVIRLRMNYAKTDSPDALEATITRMLKAAAHDEELTLTEEQYDVLLEELLKKLSAKYGVGVVVLIDEYDAPVARHIDEPELAAANAGVLHDFYVTLKMNTEYLRFVFVTGITRFALTAMDSGPNNFQDLSLDPEYAGVCGFTISEFDELFKDRMEDALNVLIKNGEMEPGATKKDLREEIRNWYDGYNWLGPERVFNPYSMLKFFNQRSFDSYWPNSGSPNHLKTLVQETPMDFINPRLADYVSDEIKKVDLGSLDAVPVLFHSGYLTIDRRQLVSEVVDGKKTKEQRYSFRAPNDEVKNSYKKYCFETVFGKKRGLRNLGSDFLAALTAENAMKVAKIFEDLLSGVTYHQHMAEEKYYHSLIHVALSAAGLNVTSESAGATGRCDMVLRLPGDAITVVEIKYCKRPEVETDADGERKLDDGVKAALKAIVEKDYAGPFWLTAKKLIGLGLAIYDRTKVRAEFMTELELRGSV